MSPAAEGREKYEEARRRALAAKRRFIAIGIVLGIALVGAVIGLGGLLRRFFFPESG